MLTLEIHYLYVTLLVLCTEYAFVVQVDPYRSTAHPKFEPIGVRTHDAQIIILHFILGILATARASLLSFLDYSCHYPCSI